MKFLKYLLFLLLIAFIGMAIYVAVQPNSFEVKQSTTINAPRAVVFETISDTTNVDYSSFWKESETLKTVTSVPNDSINQVFESDQIKNSELKWTFSSNADGSTTVSRILEADKLSFMTKAKAALFGGMQTTIENQFEEDLNSLDKRVTESMKVYTIKIDGVTDYGGGFYMYKTTSSTASNISNTMGQQYGEIMSFMGDHNLTPSGMPFTIYLEMNSDNGSVIMSNAIPVSEKVLVAEESTILCGFMERTKALKVTLQGNYTNLSEAWEKAMAYLKDNNIEASEMSPFEVYKTDPGNVPNPANWITEIYIPIKENTEVL